MVKDRNYSIEQLTFEGKDYAIIDVQGHDAELLACVVRKYAHRCENVDVDLEYVGAAFMETWEMPFSYDRFELFFKSEKDELPFLVAIELFLGWTDHTKSGCATPAEKVLMTYPLKIPDAYYEDICELMQNEAVLIYTNLDDEEFDVIEEYEMHQSLNVFELSYLGRKKKRLVDIRMMLFLGWSNL